MKFFSKKESIVVLSILAGIFLVSFGNFKAALLRARDAQRRADVGDIANALGMYQRDFGKFPLSTKDGEILACKPDDFDQIIDSFNEEDNFAIINYLEKLAPCFWGKDSLRDLTDSSYPPYMEVIPSDPMASDGYSYLYFSNGERFQLYVYLEEEEKAVGYSEGIVLRELLCGNYICNFGKSFGQTPLDKSIEEYENELLNKKK